MTVPTAIRRVPLTTFVSPDVPWPTMVSLPQKLNNNNESCMFDGEFSLLHRAEGGLSFKRSGSGDEELTMRFDFANWPSSHNSFPAHMTDDLVLRCSGPKTTLKFDTRFTKAETILIAAMVGTVLGWTPVRSKNYRAVQEAMFGH